jgi:VCBS repeat-containing protein
VLTNDTPATGQTGAPTVSAVGIQGGAAGTVGSALASNLGTLTLNSNGSFTFDAPNSVAAVRALGAGQTANVVFTYTANNSAGNANSTLTVTVTGINDAPTFTSGTTLSLAENSTVAGTVSATDPDANATLGFAIQGGADAARFTINATTGVLSFITAPDFERPGSAAGTNVYSVTVRVTDGSLTADQTLSVTVTNINEAPVITSGNSFVVAENSTAAGTVVATDPDANTTLSYSIQGGADAARFAINSAGALSFVNAPNFEAPGSAAGTNSYTVVVRVSDGTLTTDQTVTVNVTNVNEAPTISSPNSFSVAENTTAVGTVVATDPDGNNLSYVIQANADGIRFTINPTTGLLSFATAPNFEAPGSAAGTNVYTINLSVSDGTLTANQTISVTVTNVAEAPTAVADLIAIVEDAAPNTATGSVLANDSADAGATLTVTQVNGAAASVGATLTGTYGTMVINANGSYTYTLNNSLPSVQALSLGSTVFETFTYVASDGTFSTPATTVTVRITGDNDAPVTQGNRSTVVGQATTTIPGFAAGETPLGITAPTDVDTGNPMTITVTGLPTSGSVRLGTGGAAVTNGQVLTVAQLTSLVFSAAGTTPGSSVGSFSYSVADLFATVNSSVGLTVVGGAGITGTGTINGTAAGEIITATGASTIFFSLGSDLIIGSPATDTFSFQVVNPVITTGAVVDLVAGLYSGGVSPSVEGRLFGIENVNGTAFDDIIAKYHQRLGWQ